MARLRQEYLLTPTVDLEFINTLNNTTSGIVYLTNKALYASPACTANGFIGQLSVQAADFSILVIALVTLLTITRTTYLPDASTAHKALICLSVWVIPLTTASVAAGLGAIGPVSGNWCWIMSERTDLRYALTHGWRIAIIFCTAGIYFFVWWYMKRHFRSLVSTGTGTGTSGGSSTKGSWYSRRRGFRKMQNGGSVAQGDDETAAAPGDTELTTVSKSRISRVMGDDWELSAPEAAYVGRHSTEAYGDGFADVEAGDGQGGQRGRAGRTTRRGRRRGSVNSNSDWEEDDDNNNNYDNSYNHDEDNDDDDNDDAEVRDKPQARVRINEDDQRGHDMETRRPKSKFDALNTTDTTASEFPTRRQTKQMEKEIKRMLLLNAYPIMYVILWIPGMVNRFMEATGHKSNNRVLAALQASSQFVGLANALTYGFNTALRRKVKSWWKGKRRAKGRGKGRGKAKGTGRRR